MKKVQASYEQTASEMTALLKNRLKYLAELQI